MQASYSSDSQQTAFGNHLQSRCRIGRPFLLILCCFFLSGFAALLYEVVWLRQFAIIFGTSEFALAVVLSAYLAGLSLGASLAGRLVHRIRRPVLTYAILELVIAGAALAAPVALPNSFHHLYNLSHHHGSHRCDGRYASALDAACSPQ